MNQTVLQPSTPLKKERIVWIDQLKGLAFFSVIFGHLEISNSLLSWICSFILPLYFFATGFNFKIPKLLGTKPLAYCKKLCLHMLVPYFWMQFLSLIPRYIQQSLLKHKEVQVPQLLLGMLYSHSDKLDAPANPLYFVPLLFLAELLLFFLIKLTKGRRSIMFVSVFALLPLSLFTPNLSLPWHLNVVPAAAFLVLVGNVLGQVYRTNEAKIKALSLPKTLVYALLLLSIGTAVWYFNGRISIHGNRYGKEFCMALLSALATSIGLALLTMKLPKIAWLNLAGQNTLLYMGLHKPLLLCMEGLFPEQKQTTLFILCAALSCYALLLPVTLWFQHFAPFVLGKASRFSDNKIKIGQFICLVGATCVPCLYTLNHLKGGLLRSTPAYQILSAVIYLILCAALWFVMRHWIRFPFLPQREVRKA